MSRIKGVTKREQDKYLTQREIGALLHAARMIEKNSRSYAMWCIQYILGLRVGEACRLRYDHLGPMDTSTGLPVYINVPTLKKLRKAERLAGAQPPTLPVPVLGSPKMVLWVFDRKWREPKHRRSPWLFPGEDPSKPMSPKTAILWFHQAMSAAGLPSSITPHSLRHSAATRLLEKVGDRVRLVTAFLRHTPGGGSSRLESGESRTTSIYLHTTLESWQRYAGALDLPPAVPLRG